jgi:hypothetical protein
VVTKWWQCHPQLPNGNEKVGPSFAFYLSFFIFSFMKAQGEIEGHCPGVVTKWWQCHPQIPNGNEKVGS